MQKNIEIISLIYQSVDYLDFICDQLQSANCEVDGWDVGVRIVANDATPEVLEALAKKDIPYTVYKDATPQDFYLNRVYRCWNYAGYLSLYDNICFVNSDMAFSKGWLENLLKHHDGKTIPCSKLVESGKLKSGSIEKDFGKHPKEFDQIGFEKYATEIKKDDIEEGGLYMPCIFEKKTFVDGEMYPPGNIFIYDGEFVVGLPNDRPPAASGDEYFFKKLSKMYDMKHITVLNSVVYHIQEGEMDE